MRSIKNNIVLHFRIIAQNTPVRFHVLKAVKMLMLVFWVVTLCGLVGGGSMFLWNAGIYLQVYMALLRRRSTSTQNTSFTNYYNFCVMLYISVLGIYDLKFSSHDILYRRHEPCYVYTVPSWILGSDLLFTKNCSKGKKHNSVPKIKQYHFS
jgi:hypothetical protein